MQTWFGNKELAFLSELILIIKNYAFIGNIVLPKGVKDIEFERFNIDEMPGTSRITIS